MKPALPIMIGNDSHYLACNACRSPVACYFALWKRASPWKHWKTVQIHFVVLPIILCHSIPCIDHSIAHIKWEWWCVLYRWHYWLICQTADWVQLVSDNFSAVENKAKFCCCVNKEHIIWPCTPHASSWIQRILHKRLNIRSNSSYNT